MRGRGMVKESASRSSRVLRVSWQTHRASWQVILGGEVGVEVGMAVQSYVLTVQ